MTLTLLVNILAAVGALAGMLCIAHKNKLGFIIFFGVELCFTYLGLISGQYGLIACAVIYLGANIYSYQKWSETECKKQ